MRLLTQVIPVDSILFGPEMIGAVKGRDPNTGEYFDDTKRYLDACAHLSAEQRHKIFEENVRRVYPRLDTLLKRRAAAAKSEYLDPPNCQRLPPGAKLAQMMLNGEVAAAILGNDMPNDPRVRTLVPDAMAAAKTWYQREGVIPTNDIFVVREELPRERPDVVREIFRMLVESRHLAPESAKTTLPPIGFDENRKGLDMAIQWSYEQKLIPRRLSVDELFDDTTASLKV